MVINMVNPRLKSYNKPFALALAIGTITGTITAFGMSLHYLGTFTLRGSPYSWSALAHAQPLDGCIHYAEAVWGATNDSVPNPVRPCSFKKGMEQENARRVQDGDQDIQPIAFCSPSSESEDEGHPSPCRGLMILVMETNGGFYTSFGVALGQWGLVELFVTGCIVFPLLACSCIKTGADSAQALTIKEWVKGWKDLKETEVGAMIKDEAIGAAGL